VAGEVKPTGTDEKVVTPRRVVVALIVLYLLLFVILNTRRVHVSFVVFSVQTHLLTALILVAALGFLAGFFARGRTSSGKLFGAKKDAEAAAAAPPEPGQTT
jgi:uncharacterized integral membrane protein